MLIKERCRPSDREHAGKGDDCCDGIPGLGHNVFTIAEGGVGAGAEEESLVEIRHQACQREDITPDAYLDEVGGQHEKKTEIEKRARDPVTLAGDEGGDEAGVDVAGKLGEQRMVGQNHDQHDPAKE